MGKYATVYFNFNELMTLYLLNIPCFFSKSKNLVFINKYVYDLLFLKLFLLLHYYITLFFQKLKILMK